MSIFAKVAHRLSKQYQTVRFLQIGAMDGKSFDPLHPFIMQHGWQGVLVEPLPHHFASLQECYKNCKGLQFANVAIGPESKVERFYFIAPETIKEAKLPAWVAGISSFSIDHICNQQYYLKETGHSNILKYVSYTELKMITLDDLLLRHPLPDMHLLQIDAEGFDYQILKQYPFDKHKPIVVNIEYARLSGREKQSVMRLLAGHGYALYPHSLDLLALHFDHIALAE